MEGLRSITALPQESLRGLAPAKIVGKVPKFEWVDPKSLFVEEAYQRDVHERGRRLVKQIYSGFSWSNFKPPVCVRIPDFGNALVCVDGQHTATGCACHPELTKIPVMIVDAAALKDRAGAFVNHNMRRISLTPPMIYRAQLVSGDPVAVMIDRACTVAGAKVAINLKNSQPVGATISIGMLKAIAERQGEDKLVRILKILVAAKRGPIKADELAAVALIIHDGGEVAGIDDKLRAVMESKSAEQWSALAAVASAENGDPRPSALASAWCGEIGIRIGVPSAKYAGAASAGSKLLKSIPMRSKTNPVPPRPKAPAPAPAVTVPPQKPAVPDQANTVNRNGAVLCLETGLLEHRGKSANVGDGDSKWMVAALLRVSPSILDFSNLQKKVFGRAVEDGLQRMAHVAREMNPILVHARLKIRGVPKKGYVLADLGPG